MGSKNVPAGTALTIIVVVLVVAIAALAWFYFGSDPAGKGKRPETPIQRGNIRQLAPSATGGQQTQ